MTLLEEEKDRNQNLVPLLLLVGIGGILFNLYYKYDRYYLGEQLTERKIIVNESPESITSGSDETDTYSFSAANYSCRFWLSEGAYSIIKENENLEKKIGTIKKGDTLTIKIRKTDENYFQNEASRLRVIELIKDHQTLIESHDVENKDRKWFYINFGIPITTLLIWMGIQLNRFYLKNKS